MRWPGGVPRGAAQVVQEPEALFGPAHVAGWFAVVVFEPPGRLCADLIVDGDPLLSTISGTRSCITPAGFENLFAAAAYHGPERELRPAPEEADVQRLLAAAPDFGLTFVPPAQS